MPTTGTIPAVAARWPRGGNGDMSRRTQQLFGNRACARFLRGGFACIRIRPQLHRPVLAEPALWLPIPSGPQGLSIPPQFLLRPSISRSLPVRFGRDPVQTIEICFAGSSSPGQSGDRTDAAQEGGCPPPATEKRSPHLKGRAGNHPSRSSPCRADLHADGAEIASEATRIQHRCVEATAPTRPGVLKSNSGHRHYATLAMVVEVLQTSTQGSGRRLI